MSNNNQHLKYNNMPIVAYSHEESDEKIGELVCLFKFNWLFHDYIYYEINDNKFLIRTAWIITYPGKVKKSLEIKEGIKLFNFQSKKMEKENKCNWIVKSHYKEWGVAKGSIFKFSNNPNITYEHGVAIGLKAMDENYPLLEVMLLLLGMLVIPIVLILTCVYFLDKKEMRRQEQEDTYISLD